MDSVHYYLVRRDDTGSPGASNGATKRFVPMIPVDRLPDGFDIVGVPRTLTAAQLGRRTALSDADADVDARSLPPFMINTSVGTLVSAMDEKAKEALFATVCSASRNSAVSTSPRNLRSPAYSPSGSFSSPHVDHADVDHVDADVDVESHTPPSTDSWPRNDARAQTPSVRAATDTIDYLDHRDRDRDRDHSLDQDRPHGHDDRKEHDRKEHDHDHDLDRRWTPEPARSALTVDTRMADTRMADTPESKAPTSPAAATRAKDTDEPKPCKYWCRHGRCGFNTNCRFAHVMPTTLEGLQSVDLDRLPHWYIDKLNGNPRRHDAHAPGGPHAHRAPLRRPFVRDRDLRYDGNRDAHDSRDTRDRDTRDRDVHVRDVRDVHARDVRDRAFSEGSSHAGQKREMDSPCGSPVPRTKMYKTQKGPVAHWAKPARIPGRVATRVLGRPMPMAPRPRAALVDDLIDLN